MFYLARHQNKAGYIKSSRKRRKTKAGHILTVAIKREVSNKKKKEKRIELL